MVDAPASAVLAAVGAIAAQCDAHPASDGAHRLGWLLAESADPRAAAAWLAKGAGVSVAVLERWLTGEIEPGEQERALVNLLTDGELHGPILAGDWLRGGSAGWMDRPVERSPETLCALSDR